MASEPRILSNGADTGADLELVETRHVLPDGSIVRTMAWQRPELPPPASPVPEAQADARE